MDSEHKAALRACLSCWVSAEILRTIKHVQLGQDDTDIKQEASKSLDQAVDIIAGDL